MSDLLLWSIDRKFGFSLKESLLLEGLKECTDSASQETGGILVGYYTPAHDCAIVTALSGPPEDSIRGQRLFKRGTRGIQRWISRLWREQRHYYLGEWHFHPRGAPVPSPDDRGQMQKFSKDKKLKCPEPILLIIGGNPKGEWSANAYVFPADQDCVPLLPDQNNKAGVIE
jgi:integrative and conjugative element protein (TIGR02256 family)